MFAVSSKAPTDDASYVDLSRTHAPQHELDDEMLSITGTSYKAP